MATNDQRSVGRSQEYKFDRGGMPAEMGPYIGIVVNNVDNTRQGRLQVWIEQFGATGVDGKPKLDDDTTWKTVRYCPHFTVQLHKAEMMVQVLIQETATVMACGLHLQT
jgi:hypothetical protein